MTTATSQNNSPARNALVTTLIVVGVLVAAFFAFTGFYSDFLWFDQLGYKNVLTTRWIATAVMFVIGFIAMAVPLALCIQIAYRVRPVYAKLSAELDRYQEIIEPLRRLAMWGIPIFFGVFAGLSAAAQWPTVWQFFAGEKTGETDPLLGADIGFYLFDLPFWSAIVAFISAVLILSLLVSVVVMYLYGSVRITGNELRVSKPARVQLAVLAGLYLIAQAASLWLGRYKKNVTMDTRITGAEYTTANANIPGLSILAVICLIVAVLFFITAVIGRWRLPIIGTGVLLVSALVLSMAYPWAVQTFQVQPNLNAMQSPYYQNNIDATRKAYGVDNLQVTDYSASTEASAGQLRQDAEATASIRIMDPLVVGPAFSQREGSRDYYQFPAALDVDRYEIDGSMQDTIVAVREIDETRLPQPSWNNQVAVYTHGYGLVAAAGNQRSTTGEPVFLERGMPSLGFLTDEGYEPRVYFGEKSPTYSIVGAPEGTPPVELDFQRGADGASGTYSTFNGDGGPKIGGFFNKLVYALKFQSEQILFSDLVNSESQILYDRNPADRVRAVAPYLTLDSDIYPSVVDGRVVWIVDAYTVSSSYPYSQIVNLREALADSTVAQMRFAADDLNYMRNSVKATVDAYDGSVTLYAWEPDEPILKAWQKIFPNTVKPISDMSGELLSHVRYPQDLFKVQRSVLGTYHVDDSLSFAQQDNRWQTPQDPRDQQQTRLQPPYYLSMKVPGQDSTRFSLFSTFIPFSQNRNVLTGYLSVDSDAGSTAGQVADGYGTISLLEIDADTTVPGPGQVQNSFNTEPELVRDINLMQQGESRVVYGNLLTLPVGGGLLYVQPVYVQASSGTQMPVLGLVLVSFGDRIAYANTLTEALNKLFGGDAGADAGDGDIAPVDPVPPVDPIRPDEGETDPLPIVPGLPDDQAALEKTIVDALAAKDAALKSGDLTEFAKQDAILTEALTKLLGLDN